MISEYKLIGLIWPRTVTLELFEKEESFRVKYIYSKGLWDYCEGHWASINLKAVIMHTGIDKSGFPINPVIIKLLPIE